MFNPNPLRFKLKLTVKVVASVDSIKTVISPFLTSIGSMFEVLPVWPFVVSPTKLSNLINSSPFLLTTTLYSAEAKAGTKLNIISNLCEFLSLSILMLAFLLVTPLMLFPLPKICQPVNW